MSSNLERVEFGHYVVGGWRLQLLAVNGLPTFKVEDDDLPRHAIRMSLGHEDVDALREIADRAERLLEAKGSVRAERGERGG